MIMNIITITGKVITIIAITRGGGGVREPEGG
jgi:hypothetical protein